MLTWRDFLDYCDLSEDEVASIAHDEHLPQIFAAQLALMRRCGLDCPSAALLRDRAPNFTNTTNSPNTANSTHRARARRPPR